MPPQDPEVEVPTTPETEPETVPEKEISSYSKPFVAPTPVTTKQY